MFGAISIGEDVGFFFGGCLTHYIHHDPYSGLALWHDLNQKLLLNSFACAFLLSSVCARSLTRERRVHAYASSLVIHHSIQNHERATVSQRRPHAPLPTLKV
jgi:hypothetical protein